MAGVFLRRVWIIGDTKYRWYIRIPLRVHAFPQGFGSAKHPDMRPAIRPAGARVDLAHGALDDRHGRFRNVRTRYAI